MADAAAQTIKTMQELLENKNAQISRKEQIIADLKTKIIDQKRNDGEEIIKINDQITDLKRQLIEKETTYVGSNTGHRLREYEQLSRHQMSEELDRKDQQIELLSEQVLTGKKQHEIVLSRKHDKDRELVNIRQEYEDLQNNAELKASRLELKRLSTVNDKLKKKLEQMKSAIQQLTSKYQQMEEMLGESQQDKRMQVLSDEARENELQEKISGQQKKITSLEKQLSKANKAVRELKVAQQELKDKAAELESEVTRVL